MVGKKHEKIIYFCYNCPEFKKDYWVNLFRMTWGGSGHCKTGNFKIYDSSGGIPVGCPLKDQ